MRLSILWSNLRPGPILAVLIRFALPAGMLLMLLQSETKIEPEPGYLWRIMEIEEGVIRWGRRHNGIVGASSIMPS